MCMCIYIRKLNRHFAARGCRPQVLDEEFLIHADARPLEGRHRVLENTQLLLKRGWGAGSRRSNSKKGIPDQQRQNLPGSNLRLMNEDEPSLSRGMSRRTDQSANSLTPPF